MSLVDEVRSFRQRVAERLRELEPLVQEYNELKQIAAEIGLDDPRPTGSTPIAPGESLDARVPPADVLAERAKARARSSTEPRSRPRARRQSPPARRSESSDLGRRVLEAVQADPGKTVADYAEVLGVAPTALYRPIRELTTDGALVKRSRQLFPD
jgi:hypothetical protein